MGEIKQVIEKYYSVRPNKKYHNMYPSASMLGACPRASFMKLIGIPETTPPDVHAMQNFEVGNVTEAVVARALDNSGKLIDWWTDSQNYGATYHQENWKGNLRDDMWIDETLKFSGTPDLTFQSDKNESILVDVKTASTKSIPFTLKKIKAGTFWEDSLGYKYQLGGYLLVQKLRYAAKLEKYLCKYGKILIIDKNVGAIIAEPTLLLDASLEIEIRNRIEYLHNIFNDALKNGSIPPCDCNSGWKKYFGVAYCSYGDKSSILPNSKKKLVPTKCCDPELIISNCN